MYEITRIFMDGHIGNLEYTEYKQPQGSAGVLTRGEQKLMNSSSGAMA